MAENVKNRHADFADIADIADIADMYEIGFSWSEGSLNTCAFVFFPRDVKAIPIACFIKDTE